MVERKSQFIVDPRDTLIPILQGTNSLPQLYVAWKALIARMRLGVKTWGKYVAEYQLQVGAHCWVSNFFYSSSIPPLHFTLLFILLSNWKVGGLCNRYRRFYPFSMLITFHYLAFVSHDSFLYLSAVVTCDNLSSSIFQTTTTYTLHQE